MRFHPRSNRKSPASSQTQTLASDRETLPFPEGGVFSAKTSPTRTGTFAARSSRVRQAEELDQIFDDIQAGLDDMSDLLDQPFRFALPDTTDNTPDDDGPRRAA